MHMRASTKSSWNSFNLSWIFFGHRDVSGDGGDEDEENHRVEDHFVVVVMLLLLLFEENTGDRRGSRTSTKWVAPIACGVNSDTNKSFDLLQLFRQEEIWRIALVAFAAGPLTQNLVANAVAAGDGIV